MTQPIIIAQVRHTDLQDRDLGGYTIAAIDPASELRDLITRDTDLIRRATRQRMTSLAQQIRRDRHRHLAQLAALEGSAQ